MRAFLLPSLFLIGCPQPDPAAAQARNDLAPFRSVSLSNGGEVIIRHGPAQSVTIISGSPADAAVGAGQLEAQAVLLGGVVALDQRAEGLGVQEGHRRQVDHEVRAGRDALQECLPQGIAGLQIEFAPEGQVGGLPPGYGEMLGHGE